MVHDPKSPYLPVGLLDDNLDRRNRRLAGVPVLGGRHDMAAAADRVEADALLIAIPSATSDLIAELSALARAIPLTVMVLPPVAELFGGRITVEDIHRVTPEDLLGRHQVQTDVESIAGYVTGQRVLVTGAGGSIGSELSRQLHRFGPAELLLLDRDESALHGVELSIQGRALLDSRDLVLMDIRDRNGLARLFAEREPEVVFHAAALKHLPLLERHPSEAVKTNVWGTLALLEAAARSGVDRFVNISTDKAADPESVLGYSKRICERLTAEMAARTGQPFLSVRFGNVLGSRGSVLETFHRQVERGGPVTVTHPDVTRFFMTIEEAVQLVIQAGAIGAGGEVLVLDMGEPVKILDVAEMLAAQSDRPIEIVFTGLRPGEKLHERLSAIGETGGRPMHPLIQHVPVPPLPVGLVQALDPAADGDLTIELLRRLAVDDNRIDLTERSFGRV
jgi:FlaA1/EpsC-like NDP-sugar epimerase